MSKEQEPRKVTLPVLSFHGNRVSASHADAHQKAFGKYAGAARRVVCSNVWSPSAFH